MFGPMPSRSRWSRRSLVEAVAWSGAALVEWSVHWGAAAASVVVVHLAGYFRRERPVLAAGFVAGAILLPVPLGVSFDDIVGDRACFRSLG